MLRRACGSINGQKALSSPSEHGCYDGMMRLLPSSRGSVVVANVIALSFAAGCSGGGGSTSGETQDASAPESGNDRGPDASEPAEGGDASTQTSDAGATDGGMADASGGADGGDASTQTKDAGAMDTGTGDAAAACTAVGLDPTFGNHGTEAVASAAGLQVDWSNSLVVQSDGKIVVTGTGAHLLPVARFNPDGTLDTTFGTGGIATLTPPAGGNSTGIALALQSDGKLLVGGDGGSPVTWFLARLDTAGTLDATFGTAGYATPPAPSSHLRALVLRPNGAIVAADDTASPSGEQIQIAQFDSTGAPDSSFGTGGVVTKQLGTRDYVQAAALQADGKLLVAGQDVVKGDAGTVSRLHVERYATDGSLDPTFGTSGVVLTTAGGFVNATSIALQSTGASVITGGAEGSFSALRLTTAGQLDTTFGNAGVAAATLQGSLDYSVKVLVLAGDALLLAGNGGQPTDAGAVYSWGLARFTATGALDSTFGSGGTLTTDFVGTGVYLDTAALTPTGKLVAAGNDTIAVDGGPQSVLDLAQHVCP
jgi:uncharacterized delta-60 repeat protein